MIRVKEFNATGVAPNGRLFAGDLLAIMDAAAGLSEFGQTIDLSTLRVGDSSIQLLKHGTAEARVTAALRADGILRGLGGIFAGTFTTTQRDAIAAGSRPYGLEIMNTTTNRREINLGTDAVPDWRPVGPQSASGDYKISAQAASHSDPAGGMWLLCDGTAIPGTYTALIAMVGANTPDARGRSLFMKGTHANVDVIGDNDGLSITDRRPHHRHTVNDPTHAHTTTVQRTAGVGASAPGGAVGGTDAGAYASTGSATGITVGPQTGFEGNDAPAYLVPGSLFIHT